MNITIYCSVSVYAIPSMGLRFVRGANTVSAETLAALEKAGRLDGRRLRVQPGDDCLAMSAADAKAWIATCDEPALCDRIAKAHPRPTVREAAAARRDALVEQAEAGDE